MSTSNADIKNYSVRSCHGQGMFVKGGVQMELLGLQNRVQISGQ
jgi:hypothetical protein